MPLQDVAGSDKGIKVVPTSRTNKTPWPSETEKSLITLFFTAKIGKEFSQAQTFLKLNCVFSHGTPPYVLV